MKIGYVRVSKQEQHEALQIDALKEVGCEKWFVDKVTWSKAERKGLDEALAYLRQRDTLMVWKLGNYPKINSLISKFTAYDHAEPERWVQLEVIGFPRCQRVIQGRVLWERELPTVAVSRTGNVGKEGSCRLIMPRVMPKYSLGVKYVCTAGVSRRTVEM